MRMTFVMGWLALSPLACAASTSHHVTDDGGVPVDPPTAADASPIGPPAAPLVGGTGHLTYTLGNDVYRLAAATGATPENVSALVTPGGTRQRDRRLNLSSGGKFYVFETGNVDPACKGSNCLAIAPASSPSSASLVLEGGNRIEGAENLSAVSDDGMTVVFAATGSAHDRDLFMTHRTGATWSPAAALTASSTFSWNDTAALHPDGTKVLFDCGPLPGAAQGSNVCEVGIDGAGFRTVVTGSDAPGTVANKGPLHHAGYAPDGSIVFEADWDGERIWRKAGTIVTNLSTSAVANDNSPCVLPDGRVVSLWLDRPGNSSGLHELKIMSAQGSAPSMLLTGNDVSDIGIGCGN